MLIVDRLPQLAALMVLAALVAMLAGGCLMELDAKNPGCDPRIHDCI